MDYPPNSDKSKTPDGPDDKDIRRVTSEDPVRRKKGLGKQFRDTVIGGDAKTAVRYVVFEVLIPAARDTIAEAGSQGIEKLIFGDARRKGGVRPPQAGPTGYVSYDRHAMGITQSAPQRAMSRRARAQHDFDEIVLQSRTEAEAVIDQMFDILSRYETVTVSDFYALVGLPSSHTDQKWGWTELRGAGVGRVRGGYLLDLPEPKPLD